MYKMHKFVIAFLTGKKNSRKTVWKNPYTQWKISARLCM